MLYLFALLIYSVFLILVPFVSNGTLEAKSLQFLSDLNKTDLVIFHYPSLIYIGLTFSVFYLAGRLKDIGKGSNFQKEISQCDDAIQELNEQLTSTPDTAYETIIKQKDEQGLFARLLKVVINGRDEDIELKLNVEKNAHFKQLKEQIRFLGNLAALMPLLGMVGTITGLMFIFSVNGPVGSGGEDAFSNKFTAMGTALLTTLYATLITALWLKPRQSKKQKQLASGLYDIEYLKNSLLLLKHSLDLNKLHHQLILQNVVIKNEAVTEPLENNDKGEGEKETLNEIKSSEDSADKIDSPKIEDKEDKLEVA